jgi:hypothetical protein
MTAYLFLYPTTIRDYRPWTPSIWQARCNPYMAPTPFATRTQLTRSANCRTHTAMQQTLNNPVHSYSHRLVHRACNATTRGGYIAFGHLLGGSQARLCTSATSSPLQQIPRRGAGTCAASGDVPQLAPPTQAYELAVAAGAAKAGLSAPKVRPWHVQHSSLAVPDFQMWHPTYRNKCGPAANHCRAQMLLSVV